MTSVRMTIMYSNYKTHNHENSLVGEVQNLTERCILCKHNRCVRILKNEPNHPKKLTFIQTVFRQKLCAICSSNEVIKLTLLAFDVQIKMIYNTTVTEFSIPFLRGGACSPVMYLC